MIRSIATVSIGGALDEKLKTIAAAGFEAVEIFENDFTCFDGSARDVARICGDLDSAYLRAAAVPGFRGIAGTAAQAQAFRRAEKKFDLMGELGTDLLLVCSNVSPLALGGIDRAADDLRELGERAAKRDLRVGFEALAWGRYVNDYRDAWEIVRRANHPADRHHPRQLPYAGARFSRLADRGDPRRQDLPGSARGCAAARSRRAVLEPALPLLPRTGKSSRRRFHAGGRRHRLQRAAVAGNLQRPVPRAIDPGGRGRRDALAGADGQRTAQGRSCPACARRASRTRISSSSPSTRATRPRWPGCWANSAFALTGRHRSKAVERWSQGDINLLINAPTTALPDRIT